MRLVTFRHGDEAPQAGIVMDGSVGGLGRGMISAMTGGFGVGPVYDLDKGTLLAPIPRPPKLICVGLNYRDHAAETKMEIPKVPTIFNKFPSVVIGPGAPIVLPKVSNQPDYEAELAFVLGTGGRS